MAGEGAEERPAENGQGIGDAVGGQDPVKEEGKGRTKGSGERKGAAEMNPKLQEAYAFLNELALGLEQRP
jgi:hypothetical protein